MTNQELHIHKINQARKAAGKNTWWHYVSDCHKVRVKGFNTWCQILQVNGLNHWAPMDCSVKDMNANLAKALENVDAYQNA